MCIIIVKNKGVKTPDDKLLKNCWDNNRDGAGLMYSDGETVHILKGFMEYNDFINEYHHIIEKIDSKNTPMVIHFRIGTHGDKSPANTHPFIISDKIDNLKRTRVHAPLGAVHNGIINVTPSTKDISDTMEYITSQLSLIYKLSPSFYATPDGRELVYNATTSKWAFMDAAGGVYTIGDFTKDKGGLLFSNYSYKPMIATYKANDLRNFYDYYEDAYYSTNWVSLNWIENGGYIIDYRGDIIEGEGYLFNRYGLAYELCGDGDTVRRLGGQAYTASGAYAIFSDKNASWYHENGGASWKNKTAGAVADAVKGAKLGAKIDAAALKLKKEGK